MDDWKTKKIETWQHEDAIVEAHCRYCVGLAQRYAEMSEKGELSIIRSVDLIELAKHL